MTFSHFNFKKEVIVLAVLWILCCIIMYNIFPASPYQGQSIMIFYYNIVSSSFFPALFLFFVYLAIASIVEALMERAKKNKIVETEINPE